MPGRARLLPEEAQGALAAHLEGCPECHRRAKLAEWGALGGPGTYVALLRFRDAAAELRLEVPGFGDDCEEPVVIALPPRPRRALWWISGALAASAVIAILAGRWRPPDEQDARVEPAEAEELGFRGLGEPAVGVEIFRVANGSRQPFTQLPAVGETVLLVGKGRPGLTLYAWVSVSGGQAQKISSAVVGSDGTAAMPVGWAVDKPGEHVFLVTDEDRAPTRDGGAAGWTCPSGHCALIEKLVR